MTPRERILARRARFLAAAVTALGPEGCGPGPTPMEHPAAPRAALVTTTAASPTASTGAGEGPATVTETTDADADGIPDVDDACPTVAGTSDPDPHKHGCPKVSVKVCLSVVVLERPHFAPGSAKLGPETTAILDATATVMKDHPEIEEVEVAGHCDATEKPCPDAARAGAVRDALVTRGVAAGRMTKVGKGAAQPIASNDGSEGRAKNRRVELTVTKKK